MSDGSMETRSPEGPDGYISLLMHLWVGNDRELVRGFIEDVHTGERLPLDLSALASFLRVCLTRTTSHRLEVKETPGDALGAGPSAES